MGLTRRLILVVVGALMCMPMGALAQTPTGYISAPTGAPVYVGPNTPLPVLTTAFSSTGSTTLSAGTTSANVALPGAGQYVEVTNGSSTVDAYVALGVGSGTVATSGGYLVKAGRSVFLSADGLSAGTATYIAGITTASTASLTIATGNLLPVTSGGGGNVTIAAPLGAGADSTGVTVTLSTSGITDLGNTSTNTGTTATEIGATTSPAAGSVNGQLGTLIGKTGTSSAALVGYQQTTTASAVQMASNTLANGIVCQALTTNTGTDYIGPAGVTTGTGYPLVAGQAISYGVANSNQLYLIGSNTSDVVACTGN